MPTVFTFTDRYYLNKYFSSIDLAVSKRFEMKFNSDEEHLPSTLCEMLDEEGSAFHTLEYSFKKLNKKLKSSGSLIRANISIKTNKYNRFEEGKISQADLGIIIQYQDNIDASNDFKKGILLQAKRLFPLHYGFSMNSKYESYTEEQHEKITSLCETSIGDTCDDGFRY